MNLFRATWIIWRSQKANPSEVSLGTYGGKFSMEEKGLIANVSRALAYDTELKLLTRQRQTLQTNLASAQKALDDCEQKIERVRSERNLIVGKQDQKLLSGGNNKCLTAME